MRMIGMPLLSKVREFEAMTACAKKGGCSKG